MRPVSVGIQHGAQGEVGADISVEHKEGLGASSQDLVPEMVETTACAQGGKFLQVPVPRAPQASSVRSEETHKPGHLTPPAPRGTPVQGPQRNSIPSGIQRPQKGSS